MRVILLLLLTIATLVPAGAVANPRAVGSPTAPITLEVFSDFQCPHCRKLHMETLSAAVRDCVAKGKVQIVNRDFPLSQHPYAKLAARYANAGARLGLYAKICDELFLRQDEWGANGNVDAVVARVVSAADMVKIRAAVKDPKIDTEMNEDIALGTRARLNQTPTMILTYKGKSYQVAGFVSYEVLGRFVDSLLQK